MSKIIYSQAQVNRLSDKLFDGKKDLFIHVSRVRYLYIRMQKNKNGFSASYVCRFTQNGKSHYNFLGTTREISLSAAIEKCALTHALFKNEQKLFLDLRCGSFQITGGNITLLHPQKIISSSGADLTSYLFDGSQQDTKTPNIKKVASTKNINDLLEEYGKIRNIKDNTMKAYKTAVLRTTAPKNNPSISELTPTTINNHFSQSTLVQYVSILKSLLHYAQACGYIEKNPFANTCNFVVTTATKHRAALHCENFDTLEDAEKEVGLFLKKVEEDCVGGASKNLFFLWMLHMVLATRISETVRVMSLYSKWTKTRRGESKFVTIETKTAKKGQEANFRIPLTPKLKILLNKVCKIFCNYSEEYIKKLISQSIPKSYRNRIKAHGTRAIYRTVIDFLASEQIDVRAREYYINHNTLNKVAQAYNRNDLITSRTKIQEIYIAWLEKLMSNFCKMKNCFGSHVV